MKKMILIVAALFTAAISVPAEAYRAAPVYRSAPVYRPAVRTYSAPRVYRAPVRTHVAPVRTHVTRTHVTPRTVHVTPKRVTPHATVHRPTRAFTRPAHVRHNPAHRVGSWGRKHNHRSFVYRHGGHRWHRYYYTAVVAGVVGWYWYDTAVDAEATSDDGLSIPAAAEAIPECDPNSDNCSGSMIE